MSLKSIWPKLNKLTLFSRQKEGDCPIKDYIFIRFWVWIKVKCILVLTFILFNVYVDASSTDVKKAYHKKALKYHPDRNPDKNEAEVNMAKIAQANSVLSDEEKRKVYDKWGSKVGAQLNKVFSISLEAFI